MTTQRWPNPTREELDQMAQYYEINPKKISGLPTDEFLWNIQWRVYTEWCLQNRWLVESHGSYKGTAFKEWIDAETHCVMGRAGFKWEPIQYQDGKWHPLEYQFVSKDGQDVTSAYQTAKQKVLQAVVARGIDFLKASEGSTMPKEGDNRNLRGSLESYLQ